MSSHQHDIELIERFFRQELNEDELLDFENRVRQDPDFSKEVILMRDIFYSVKMAARIDLKTELKEIQAEALSQPVKPYKPAFNWLKWIKGLVICGIIAVAAFSLFDKHNLEKIKSMFMVKDSTTINDTVRSVTPGPEGATIIKDPSDPRYKNMEADFKLQVKDPSTFKIEKITSEEDGLYKYKIEADGKTHIVSSPNPNLNTELLQKKESKDTSSVIKVKRNPAFGNENEIIKDPIEGVDF